MSKSHVVEFHRLATIPEPRPAKATLRPDVRVSVQRSINKLPVLGQRNPDAALLIERSIDDYMLPPDDDGGQNKPAYTVIDWSRTPEAERSRQLRAGYQRVANGGTLDGRVYRCLMDMLRDMSADLSAAS